MQSISRLQTTSASYAGRLAGWHSAERAAPRWAKLLVAFALSLAAASSASAQLIYFVNARTGAPGNNGLTPAASFAKLSPQ